ncbi:type II toxin-antitoxin system RatA family toxin [Xylophilus sp. ASV27]|uniref:type II toxin-antitoxin system RatA family toxin n=1 Tax=Xylophilus sp. ASV27 TaxID=2795129 RepID=UPI0018EC78B2|nr:type II toxin-antitoxin system RatA family toxin [Xylophilus sp. ASV27]
MKTVHKSVLIWYSAEEMFRLVTNVTQYPQFLPWCDRAAVLSEDAEGMTAQVGIAFSGLRQSFTTRNTHVPGREVRMQLVDGPFSQLEGLWRFVPVGEGAQRACRIEFDLRYGFSNAALSALVGPVFDRIAGSMVDAFVARAEKVYGDG